MRRSSHFVPLFLQRYIKKIKTKETDSSFFEFVKKGERRDLFDIEVEGLTQFGQQRILFGQILQSVFGLDRFKRFGAFCNGYFEVDGQPYPAQFAETFLNVGKVMHNLVVQRFVGNVQVDRAILDACLLKSGSEAGSMFEQLLGKRLISLF